MANRTYTTNKRAHFDYELLETFVAGIVLEGHEVKSVRDKGASLKGAYVTISERGEAWLTNSHISLYKNTAPDADYDPERARKLLLNKSEIEKLTRARNDKNVLVALSMYAAGPNIKLSLAVGRPKKLHDKRHTIKKRDADRDAARFFKP